MAGAAGAAPEGKGAAPWLSPASLASDPSRKLLYIAASTANRVLVFETASETVRTAIPVSGAPSGLALSDDGALLYVTSGVSPGTVDVVDTRKGSVAGSFRAGHSPNAPVLGSGGRTLYVANRFTNDIRVFDPLSGAEVARIAVLREPVAARLSADGARLFVANQLPEGPANAKVAAAAVSVVDTRTKRAAAHVRLRDGSTGLRDLALSPDGRYLYATHVLARYQLPASQIERGWIQTNALSVIDTAGPRLVNTVLLDDITEGAAVPWGLTVTPDGKRLCVAHSGTHEISVIDREALHRRLEQAAAGTPVTEVTRSAADVVNDMTFLTGIRTRVPLAGNGPRGLLVAGTAAYAAEYFTGSVAVLDLEAAPLRARSVKLGDEPPPTLERRGEMLFHDAQYTYQKWLSCPSCHPSESRPDGLNWDLLLDAVGNPKNTRSLLLAHRTPPTTITGTRPNAEASVRSGFRFIEFANRPEEHAVAVDAWLKSLRPLPSPHLENGRQSASAVRGEKVFAKAGCAACHSGELYTGLGMHDVGTSGKQAFDTPTLIEVWRTAPYLHDGRAATLQDVFLSPGSGRVHYLKPKLSRKEIEDLIAFVLSL
jgi:DNA-binding beta-propeller fold protein YncE